MSCANCEALQETFVDGDNEIYVRVGIANVQIIACPVHAKALIDTYRKGLDQLSKENDHPSCQACQMAKRIGGLVCNIHVGGDI
jgi:hypothetical protein